jgi:hypothetical protein
VVVFAPKFHSLGEGCESFSYSPLVAESSKRLPNVLLRDLRIASGRLNVDVPRRFLYDPQVLRAA